MNNQSITIAEANEIMGEYYPQEEYTENDTADLDNQLNNKIENTKSKINFLCHIKALRNYFLDKNVKWFRKSVVVAALVYFITPIDTIPDISPFIGFLDDLGIIAWTIKFLGDEIKRYY
jgi:uncharacterized membrane protein YkvA (DUF1232 family)